MPYGHIDKSVTPFALGRSIHSGRWPSFFALTSTTVLALSRAAYHLAGRKGAALPSYF
jgi:hypothetical protein